MITVVTYHFAYLPGTTSLCDRHAESPYTGTPTLGAVSQGAHDGECDSCGIEAMFRGFRGSERKDRMMQKYEFTAETVTSISGKTLRRIRRLSDGELGGFIEKEQNLSHEGSAWVSGEARVYGEARVSGEAQVYGDARVFAKARVSGDARVLDKAWVSGKAKVFGEAWVSAKAQVFGEAWVSGKAWVLGEAQVFGDAQIFGDARIFGDAQVYGEALVFGDAQVFGDTQVFGDARIK